MIYITYKHCSFSNGTHVNNVWESQYSDLEIAYKTFLKEMAHELNIVINPHWRNIMNYEDHNKHLTKEEYKLKSKEWKRILKLCTFDAFIEAHGKGKKLKYIDIVR